jgi:hypothetical protein
MMLLMMEREESQLSNRSMVDLHTTTAIDDHNRNTRVLPIDKRTAITTKATTSGVVWCGMVWWVVVVGGGLVEDCLWLLG